MRTATHTPERRAPQRHTSQHKVRMSAIEIVTVEARHVCNKCHGSGESTTNEWAGRPCEACGGSGDPPPRWMFRLNDRATHLELALLRVVYALELVGEDSGGMLLKPRDGTPKPTLAEVAAKLNAINERRHPHARD